MTEVFFIYFRFHSVIIKPELMFCYSKGMVTDMDVKVEVKKTDGSMEHVMIDSQNDTVMISMMFNDDEDVDIVELLHGILKAKHPKE